ncbi:NAD(P)/FAD-dependent oxidoreductase [Pedobacter heparinus]|uniref:HI0933 family protein n=1 Tax=Pedobacter heparinus (strain ATCC 13125 / DSM 2366 / CIP 104194 / JCM 7457 / NBRC 12017 / NCIMB 9290 / NRRL B-14731 / HIM 762-3) TaxID=485917 RepID=C6XW28_PEDHD|nr:aminoacetone oxidase family FAD-binding enzyme [Pedobacter heparinus]ACU04107.1 HI0933 family protein [Pedobacter heparinus DSM 2366]
MLILHKNNNINGLMDADAIIIGAGACGLMCAVQAGYLGKRVILLEKNAKPGAKILISGGGRCNYTNLFATDEQFISGNRHFIKSAFTQWTVEDTISFFETYGINGKEKTLGQLFPESNNAAAIVAVFTALCEDFGQELICDTVVTDIKILEAGFAVNYAKGTKSHVVKAPKLVMATGGLPIPKMGATDFALRFARKQGLKIVETAPALVPLTITGKDEDWYAQLSGNSVYCKVSNERIAFEENILFTHWGLSGPAILQISSYWKRGEVFNIDLLPGQNITALIETERKQNGKALLSSLFNRYYARKFTEAMAKYLPIDKQVASLTKAEMEQIEQTIHWFKVKPAGDKGYDKAEVMRGGIDTDELSSKTLECKKIPGLYFGGECVDVTGWLGGYNFQWAWASGFVIAQQL